MSSIEEVLMELREAERSKDSAQALVVATDALNKLSEDDRRKLLDMPAVQKLLSDAEVRAAEKMKPGSAMYDDKGRVVSKVPWTFQQMCDEFGTVDWTPMQNRLICINGIDLWVETGRPVRTPPQFRDVAMEAFHAEQNQLQTTKDIMTRNFGENSMVLSGDGTRL